MSALLIAAPLHPGLARAQAAPVTAAEAEKLGAIDAVAPTAVPSPAAAPSPSVGSASPIAEASPAAAATPAMPELPPSKVIPAAVPAWGRGKEDAIAPDRPVIKDPVIPAISQPDDEQVIVGAPSTEEIPQAAGGDSHPGASTSTPTIQAPDSGDINRYQTQLNGDQFGEKMGTLREFVSEGDETSSIGVELHEAHRKLKGGEEADGLLVINVMRESPAAKAGLKPYRRIAQNMLTGATIAAAMVFPPAILILPVLDYTQIGESYDMIIGVDGVRVTNFVDFEDRMRDVQPGQLVYLSVVRNGKRMQVSVPVPPSAPSPSN